MKTRVLLYACTAVVMLYILLTLTNRSEGLEPDGGQAVKECQAEMTKVYAQMQRMLSDLSKYQRRATNKAGKVAAKMNRQPIRQIGVQPPPPAAAVVAAAAPPPPAASPTTVITIPTSATATTEEATDDTFTFDA